MKIHCLIVDDEPPAQKVLRRFIGEIPFLELSGVCSDAFEALELLNEKTVDLLFLDIQMPKLTGIQLLKSLPHHPKVIITTAFPEFAVEGFELSVTDYLVKPFSFERFLTAVQKVQTQLKNEQSFQSHARRPDDSLTVRADKKYYRVTLHNIRFLQAYGDYVKIYRINESMLLVKEKLSHLEEKLPQDRFIRVHRSYIVSIGCIQFLEGNRLNIGDDMIPVSANYRDQVLKHL